MTKTKETKPPVEPKKVPQETPEAKQEEPAAAQPAPDPYASAVTQPEDPTPPGKAEPKAQAAPKPAAEEPKDPGPAARFETVTRTRADGSTVTFRRNIDTGKQTTIS